MALLNQTTTVQQIVDQLQLHTNLQNFFNAGGVSTYEPGMTVCNKTNQMLLSKSKAWKFNRKELSGPPNNPQANFFMTQYGVQDILHAGACAFTLLVAPSGQPSPNPTWPSAGVGIDLAVTPVGGGTAGITVAAGVVTVQTLQQHPFFVGQTVYLSGCTVAAYNSVFTFNINTPGSAWTNGFVITVVPDLFHFKFAAITGQTVSSGAPGISDWGWGESGYLTDPNSQAFPQPILKLEMVDRLAPSYFSNGGEPEVCMLIDQQNGVLKFRMSEPWGTQTFQINTVYQARAGKLALPTDVIQWPNNLRFAFDEVALWMAYRFAKSVSAKETMGQYQIALAAIQSVMSGDDNESSGEAIVPDRGVMAW